MKASNIIIYISLIILAFSCSEEFQNKLKSNPNALGTANQVVVIADQDLWDGIVGDTFRMLYEAAYPMLPRPESIFDLKHYTPNDLEAGPLRKELRTYLFLADLSNPNSPTVQSVARDLGEEKIMTIKKEGVKNTTVGRDKWAMGQLMLYVVGEDQEKLIENITKSFPSISKKVYQHDYKQIKGYTFAAGYNKAISSEIEEKLGVKVQVPADYIKALWDEEEKLMWIRKETSESTFGMVLKSLSYESEDQLSKEFLKEQVNQFGKDYVKTNTEGSYMVVNDEDLPLYTNTIEINGQYAYEMRGIWETTKDYMGGPFFAYVIIDKSQKKLLFILDFLMAPGKEKRDLMQQMELMTNTVEFL
ncbi:DUF4837 family protein [Portibacter lacus]|uniref:DUF4837 family protein n=1 Tax=Portibacter lacus TaxID=1099794 RepID=A0AA37WDP2_9BACT|nr:DUF4837 family protein [Portibacter lacus]GLR18146.1 hypothetical protein GCM10007940_27610 [Portibacter lacus]